MQLKRKRAVKRNEFIHHGRVSTDYAAIGFLSNYVAILSLAKIPNEWVTCLGVGIAFSPSATFAFSRSDSSGIAKKI